MEKPHNCFVRHRFDWFLCYFISCNTGQVCCAEKSLSEYVTNEKLVSNEAPLSWVVHYKMLEASWMLLKEHPILGVGSKH